MKPIAYFSQFDTAKKQFIDASKTDDFKAKLESARNLTKLAYEIIQKNYASGLKNEFNSQAKKHPIDDAREMFATWVPLVEETIEGFRVAAMYYENFHSQYTQAIDMLNSFTDIPEKHQDKELKVMIKDFIKQLKNDDFFKTSLEGIDLITKGMNIPLSLVTSMVTDFAKDSYLLREEKDKSTLN